MKVVILCGGHGTRLWPISRQTYPKPFVPLFKGKSFFQITYARFKKVYSPEDIFVSTEDRYFSYVRKQAPDIPKKNIIMEPERKDTLAACGLACAIVNKYYPDETVFFSWAKHIFRRESVFLNAITAAAEYAQKTSVTVAIDSKPEFASIHNGWVKMGKTLDTLHGFKIVQQEKHIEKPKEALAKRLFESGDWLIHTGYKVWKGEKLLDYLRSIQPDMYKGLMKIAEAWGTQNQSQVLNSEYHKFIETSIDYGLLEKLPQNSIATINADMGWEDLGISWETYYRTLATPKEKTVIEGGADTEFLDSDENLVIGPKGKLIVVIGLNNVAIVDTADGLLVCKLDQTQKMKDVYEKIEKYHKEYTE